MDFFFLSTIHRESAIPPALLGTSAMPSSPSCSSEGESMASSHTDLKTRAPVVPFDMDLYHWNQPSSSVEPRTLAP